MTPEFTHIPELNSLARVVSPLIANRGDDHRYAGTAVIISPRFALTAMHVVDEFRAVLDGRHASGTGVSFNLTLFSRFHEDQTGILWNVKSIVSKSPSDIALLVIEPGSPVPPGKRIGLAEIELFPPAVGERIVAFGHPVQDVHVEDDAVTVVEETYSSLGQVTEVFPLKRDSAVMPVPCYATTARFDGGMSGGPLFNDDGRLCGLVSSSMSHDETGEHTSYASTLWPILAFSVEVNDPAGTRSVTLLDLFRDGQLSGVGWESVGFDGKNLAIPKGLLEGRPTSARRLGP